jgi:RHS repeat-associated protein
VGNRLSATEGNGRSINWNYDGVYRLTSETIRSDPAKVNGTAACGLDSVGSRKSESSTISGLNPGTFSYNVDDEVSTDTYDFNGNTLTTGGKTFTYDSENELKTMNGGAVTLIYDGDGNRVAKSVNGVTTRYLIDDLNPTGLPQVVEELVNGVVQRQYTYGLQLISENQLISNTWTASFYETDGAGNVRQLTNSAGAVTDSYEYDTFGNEVTSTGATPNSYLYRGEQYDTDLSLYYLRARYYNPATGRFLSVDSEAGQGQRRYEYAGADPVNGTDPSGNEAIVEFALLQFYPGRLSVHFPGFCGLPLAGGASLPGCGGPGAPPPPKPPCNPNDPNCCKKCFDTAAFAQTINSEAVSRERDPSKYQGKCAHVVGDGLQAGGINARVALAGDYGPVLLRNNFEIVDYIPQPKFHSQHNGEQGDITIFGIVPGHTSGHAEGYTGTSSSGWTSYWRQNYWTPYGPISSKTGLPNAPHGPATIYRNKCRCGQ